MPSLLLVAALLVAAATATPIRVGARGVVSPDTWRQCDPDKEPCTSSLIFPDSILSLSLSFSFSLSHAYLQLTHNCPDACNTTDWCNFDNAFAQATCQPRVSNQQPCFSLGMGLRCLSGTCKIDPSIPPHPRLGQQGVCINPENFTGEGTNCSTTTARHNDCYWASFWCDNTDAFGRNSCQFRVPESGVCYYMGGNQSCSTGLCKITLPPVLPPSPRRGPQGRCIPNPDNNATIT